MKKFILNIRKYFKYAVKSAKAELKSEVADSYLNWLWWIIEPFCFMLIYSFVFGKLFGNSTQYFLSFIFIGLTLWEFFNRMISGSVNLIINNRDLVTKVYIPKYILLLSKSFTYLFKMGISFCLAIILMICQHVPFTWYALLIIPIVIILYILSFGIGMILMHFGVTLNDLSNLTNIGLRMVFYLSGVFYDINTKLKKHVSSNITYLMLRANPVAFLMSEARKALLYGQMINLRGLIFWFIVGIILCIIGIRTIHKNENSYAKVI